MRRWTHWTISAQPVSFASVGGEREREKRKSADGQLKQNKKRENSSKIRRRKSSSRNCKIFLKFPDLPVSGPLEWENKL